LEQEGERIASYHSFAHKLRDFLRKLIYHLAI
jgi:hypothetical protein